jgi:hypothetical protein
MTTNPDRWAGDRPTTAFVAPAAPAQKPNPYWSPETGYTLRGRFYWAVYRIFHTRILR